MKVAVSTDGDQVSSHFGRCPLYTIAQVEGGVVVNKETIENPGHHPGFLPEFFREKGVSCILAGGMGARAQSLFEQFGVECVLGVSGPVSAVLQKLAEGHLAGSENACTPKSGKGYGMGKSACDHGADNHHED